jgi:flagellar biosynthetic protein FliO
MIKKIPLLGLIFMLVSPLAAQVQPDTTGIIPFSESSQPLNMTWLFFKTMGLLVVIIFLILLSVFLIKKYLFNPARGTGESGWIRVLGQTQIHPKNILTLVKVLDKVILLGSTDTSVENLAEFNNIPEVQLYLDRMEKKQGAWRENKFLRIIKKNLES